MKLGISISTFPWPAEEIGPEVSRIATAADEAGVDSLWVMDHFFQIRLTGLPPESPMPEAYATLAFLGGLTRRIKLGTLVTSVAYRHPGVLVKAVTTLDVMTGGRAIFGVGAGAPWNIAPAGPGTAFEAEGLGIPFPSLAERFERLEELLQIAHQMWRGDESPYQGRHYQLVRPLNSPNSVQRPHPPILIGGSGERKTLRMVAQYADACNLFDIQGSRFRGRPHPQARRAPRALRAGRPRLRRNRKDRRHQLRSGRGSQGGRCGIAGSPARAGRSRHQPRTGRARGPLGRGPLRRGRRDPSRRTRHRTGAGLTGTIVR